MADQPDSHFSRPDAEAGQTQSPIDPRATMPPPPPPPHYYPPPPSYSPPGPSRRSSWLGRLATGFVSTLLLVSLSMNLYFGIFFASMSREPHETLFHEGDASQRIVILPIEGTIDEDTARFVRDVVKKLRKNPPKAIVLRVNSGGGGVSASDRIWHDLSRLKQESQIPIVASFGSIAASGGYYISMPADHIFVEPTTITGSIGVIAQAFTVHELLDKIGVQPELIAATEAVRKDRFNPMRPWSDDERAALRLILDEAQDRFVGIVDQGRSNLDLNKVKQLATGEVYTASQALDHELVDEEGYLENAIDKAKTLAGISVDPEVTILSPANGLGILGQISTPVPDPASINGRMIHKWIGELTTAHIEYRWVP